MSRLNTLKPRVPTQAGRLAVQQPGSWRPSGATANERGYTYKWQKASKAFLEEHPLCRYCERAGFVTASQLVDHIVPHRGDQSLFWRRSNWQALCRSCHSGEKQREEAEAG
ncbi:HNH endonuclease [Pigmentiphaga litoralis]|nr:HNH endonuclease [Pigmentiphaga litoralis]